MNDRHFQYAWDKSIVCMWSDLALRKQVRRDGFCEVFHSPYQHCFAGARWTEEKDSLGRRPKTGKDIGA